MSLEINKQRKEQLLIQTINSIMLSNIALIILDLNLNNKGRPCSYTELVYTSDCSIPS